MFDTSKTEKPKLLFTAILFAFTNLHYGCGGDDNDKKKSEDPPGITNKCSANPGDVCVSYADSETDKASLKFPAADEGSWLLLPFIAGNRDRVSGGNNTKLSITPEGLGQSLLEKKRKPSHRFHDLQSKADLERTILNRFDPKTSKDDPELWLLADQLDKLTPSRKSLYGKSISDILRSRVAGNKKSLANETDKTICPESEDDEVFYRSSSFDSAREMDSDVASVLVKNDNFCLVFLDDPPSSYDPDYLQATVSKIFKFYKDRMYQDTFPKVKNFSFKPIFIIYDSDREIAGSNLEGAFLSEESRLSETPILYMNLNAIAERDESVSKRTFVATLAHELQHAISYYYRVVVQKTSQDTVAVDEGLAHMIEEMLGFGDLSFADYLQVGLQTITFGTSPFLWEGGVVDDFDKSQRGSAQALIHYLASQKGDLTYENGSPTSGPYTQFLVDLVKSSSLGAKNLAEAAGGSWPSQLTNFLAAVFLDNLDLNTQPEFQTSPVVEGVTDFSGVGGKTVGIRFNNFRGMPSPIKDSNNFFSDTLSDDEIEVSYYQTKALLHSPTTDFVDFVFSESTDAGILAIKVP